MLSRNPFRSELYVMSSLLSQKVSSKDIFFQEIALMGVDERVAYSFLYAIDEIKFFEKDITKMNIIELIKEIIMPIIQRIGQAKFKADPLTHLGMKVGEEKRARDFG